MAGRWNSNFSKVKSQLLRIPVDLNRDVKASMEEAAKEVGQMILTKADEYVPEDNGDLRASGQVLEPVWNGNSVTVTVKYGGDSVDYAFYVHENMPSVPYSKNYTRPGTGPKYLERAGDEEATRENITTAFRRAMNRRT